jgi:SNF2 family DNA or RNA helicase
MQAQLLDNKLQIQFKYKPDLIEKVKTLHERHYLKGDTWEAPLVLESVEKLAFWGFNFCPDLKRWYATRNKETELPGVPIPGLKRTLFPFQHTGVCWVEAARGRTIIGDQQGLGKTTEQLAWLQLHPEARPVVVVCPGSAKWTYHSEAALVMSRKCKTHVISGLYSEKEYVQLPKADIYIINYEILYTTSECSFCKGKGKKDNGPKKVKCQACKGNGKVAHVRCDLLQALNHQGGVKVVLLDECQYLQEPTSYRTQAVQKLCRGEGLYIIPSSGTPIKHRPKNFFPTLNLVRPDLFPSFFSYAHRYCGATKGFGGHWDFNGASNLPELHAYLEKHRVLLRRTKAEVLPDLPKIIRAPVLLELDREHRAAYTAASQDFLEWLRRYDIPKLSSSMKAETLTKINYLKQMAARYKIKQVISWIEDFLDAGDPLIIYAHHKAIVDKIFNHFKKIAIRVDGSTTPEQKRDAETAFQACGGCGVKKDKHSVSPHICEGYVPGPTRLFIGTLAAKESLTLTAASDVAFVELWDSPKDHEQAEERCYGRVSDPHGATAWYFLAGGTIEEELLANLEYKREVIDALVDGKSESSGHDDSLIKLLEKIKEGGSADVWI